MSGRNWRVLLEEPAAGNLHGGVCEGGVFRWGHGGPKRARSWKRRIQPRKHLQPIGTPLLGEMSKIAQSLKEIRRTEFGAF